MATTTQRDYYDILGVERDASPEEIKRAYRKLALRFHPDRNPGDSSAGESFKEASEAYSVLKDPEKRSRYDRFGRAGVGAAGPVVGSEVFADIEDLFGGSVFDLFGEMFGGSSRRQRPVRGRNVQYELRIPFAEPRRPVQKRVLAVRDEPCDTCSGSGARPGTRPIVCGRCGGSGQETISRGIMMMSRTCTGCGGRGRVIRDRCGDCAGRGRTAREREVPVRVPAGVDDGVQLRIPGQGELGRNGGPPGDLYVRIHVEPAPGMERQGRDVVSDAVVSFPEAALGTEIPVTTIWGEASLRVPAGTQPGQRLSLAGKGFPSLKGHGRGDHLVRIGVEVPRRLSRAGREAMETLAAELARGRPANGSGAGEADRNPSDRESRGSLFGRLFSHESGRRR